MKRNNLVTLLILVVIGFFLWVIPAPEGIADESTHILAVFVFTILALMFSPVPVGVATIISITVLLATKTLSFEKTMSGFSHPTVWLIVIAFFISRSIVQTGLGARIAYHLIRLIGRTPLGLGYGIAIADLVLAPCIPSNTARAGGILFPIINSLGEAFDSKPHAHRKKIGAYLIQVAMQGVVVTSAMFLTAMSGNPIIAQIVGESGVAISWGSWALYMSVPGLITLALIPLILYRIYPPEIEDTAHAPELARQKLRELGPMSRKEKTVVATMVLLIGLWMLGNIIGLSATASALVGLVILLLTHVLEWDDLLAEKAAWNTLIWFAALVMMAAELKETGLITWAVDQFASNMVGMSWHVAFAIITLVYFYAHYFFASNVAHICAMFPAFFVMALSLGVPPALAAIAFGAISNLFGSLTQYSSGPAPILYGGGYVKIEEWWKLGLIFSIVFFVIWSTVGIAWWKLLGLM